MFGQSDEEFIQKLKDISTMQHSVSVEFPHLGQNARATHAMNDPITYVAELKSVINDVLTVLFGVEPESFYAKSEGKSSRKTRYFRFRMKGVMGYTLAFYGVVEDHQRGTLHFHLVIYGVLLVSPARNCKKHPSNTGQYVSCKRRDHRSRPTFDSSYIERQQQSWSYHITA